MISMSDFKQLIQLRNSGKTQDEISKILGISRRSVVRYLKDGKIPIYSRENKSNRTDPIKSFLQEVKDKLKLSPKIELSDLFNHIKALGYTGSERTLRRKTRDLRLELKNKNGG
jgi:predicted transcriptional regulator